MNHTVYMRSERLNCIQLLPSTEPLESKITTFSCYSTYSLQRKKQNAFIYIITESLWDQLFYSGPSEVQQKCKRKHICKTRASNYQTHQSSLSSPPPLFLSGIPTEVLMAWSGARSALCCYALQVQTSKALDRESLLSLTVKSQWNICRHHKQLKSKQTRNLLFSKC